MGLGDGKLAIGIGWFLGMTLGMSAVMFGFWIGALFAVVMMVAQRIQQKFTISKITTTSWTFKSEIPFGPFLILGVFIVYFTHINFFDGSVNIIDLLL